MEAVSFLQPWFLAKKAAGSTAVAVERDLLVVIDGLGSVPGTGVQGDARIDFDTTIVGWTILADQAGSVELDIWKDIYANYPPDVGDTIVAAAPPFVTTDDHNASTVLTGWTTAITAGDCLRFSIVSISTITRLTLALHLEG
jgi:hypothetical protein